MKEVIFATTNPTKSKRFSEGLLENNIRVKSLNDIDLKLDVEENGNDAIENALLKARACYNLTNLASIGMDDTLYLENVPLEKQPGLFVRRINGRSLTDKEMLDYYISLVQEYGIDGKLNCKWVYGIAVIDEYGNENTYTWNKEDIYMVDKASNIINPGYPLNSISKYRAIDKYIAELEEEEKKLIKVYEDDVVEFIKNNI